MRHQQLLATATGVPAWRPGRDRPWDRDPRTGRHGRCGTPGRLDRGPAGPLHLRPL